MTGKEKKKKKKKRNKKRIPKRGPSSFEKAFDMVVQRHLERFSTVTVALPLIRTDAN